MNTVSFTAKYICNTHIKEYKKNSPPQDKEVVIVELDKKSEGDKAAIFNIAKSWDIPNKRNYSWCMYNSFKREKQKCKSKNHIYALTTQNKSFDKLDSKKILGLIQFSELPRGENSIDWFQVRPKYNYVISKDNRKYTHVGKALLEFTQKKFSKKPIYVSSSEDAIEFYEKYGFVSNREFDYEMCYKG